ncbi:hypothetical protein ACFO1B_04730 [Dactylosporangium siamense]|uniref:hypothetical protein n=1 Tax=Dactylosporangium siamense TaxID=685454 RepID=UPI00194162E3|nr:hypothetical protein [Dactylosporangium siamense]
MEETWFDGDPAEALAALGAEVHLGAVGVADARAWLDQDRTRRSRPVPGREVLRVAATAAGARTRVFRAAEPGMPDGAYLCGTVLTPERLAAITAWLDAAWAATAAVHVVEERGVRFRPGNAPRPVPPPVVTLLGVVTDPAALAALRRESSTGVFGGDVCRCGPDLKLQLRAAGGDVLGVGDVHRHGCVVWEQHRFHSPVTPVGGLPADGVLASYLRQVTRD